MKKKALHLKWTINVESRNSGEAAYSTTLTYPLSIAWNRNKVNIYRINARPHWNETKRTESDWISHEYILKWTACYSRSRFIPKLLLLSLVLRVSRALALHVCVRVWECVCRFMKRHSSSPDTFDNICISAHTCTHHITSHRIQIHEPSPHILTHLI